MTLFAACTSQIMSMSASSPFFRSASKLASTPKSSKICLYVPLYLYLLLTNLMFDILKRFNGHSLFRVDSSTCRDASQTSLKYRSV